MITFTVTGTPVPQGSLTFYGRGKPTHRDDLKPWRNKVRAAYVQQAGSREVTGGARLGCEFVLPRPKAHYGTGANAGRIKPSYEKALHTVKPDLDKLMRAIGDALTLDKGDLAGLPRPIADDAQIVEFNNPRKRYVNQGEEPHVVITIGPAYT